MHAHQSSTDVVSMRRDLASAAERDLLVSVQKACSASSVQVADVMASAVWLATHMLVGKMLRVAATSTAGLSAEQVEAVGSRIDLALASTPKLSCPVPSFTAVRRQDGQLQIVGTVDHKHLRLAYEGVFKGSLRGKQERVQAFSTLVPFPAIEVTTPTPQVVVNNYPPSQASRAVHKRDGEGFLLETLTVPVEGAVVS